jgi:hypothetical protein
MSQHHYDEEENQTMTCPGCGKTAGGYDEREGWIEFAPWKNERTGEVLFAAVLCPDCARREAPDVPG